MKIYSTLIVRYLFRHFIKLWNLRQSCDESTTKTALHSWCKLTMSYDCCDSVNSMSAGHIQVYFYAILPFTEYSNTLPHGFSIFGIWHDIACVNSQPMPTPPHASHLHHLAHLITTIPLHPLLSLSTTFCFIQISIHLIHHPIHVFPQ